MSIAPDAGGEMFIPPDTWLPADNYALKRNATFSTNLVTNRRLYLERHGGDLTRVNTALATLGQVHFALVTIATMPPLVHNLLYWPTIIDIRNILFYFGMGSNYIIEINELI